MKKRTQRLMFLLVLFSCITLPLFAQEVNTSVKKVHIIFKTHLDIGFTNLSSVVEKRYINEFIPKAIAVSEELRSSGAKERYVWTTGSWLIWSFLEQALPEQKRRLEQAIKNGDIAWNGVPYTVESEAMNKDLFEIVLNLSKLLDKRYGKETIAAKMTDVPGHTRSIVPLLQKANIHFLHIGVNPASTIPHVPEISRWRDKDGSEIVLMYQNDYGDATILPDGETAMVIAFTGDNAGPHTVQQVKDVYASLQKRYPNAELQASTLSDVARDIEPLKELLPIVTTEIGDTWIYGIASSPVCMSRYRTLSRLYSRWVQEKRIDPASEAAVSFAVSLGLVAEHTWGISVGTHLLNWDKYDFDSFQQARKLPGFMIAETSWKEKEANIDKAIKYLPVDLREEAERELSGIGHPAKQRVKGMKVSPEMTNDGVLQINLNGFCMHIGEITYQSFSTEDFNRFHEAYVTQKVEWAIQDFGKRGLRPEQSQSISIKPVLKNCDTKKISKGKEIACRFVFPKNESVDTRVFPEEMYANYLINTVDGCIDLDVTIMDKPANRLPEAYWISFLPEQITRILVEKTGTPVDVLDIVEGGNRQMHGIDRYVDVITTVGRIRITSLDAPLVTVGERNLLNYSVTRPDIRNGVHFCLFNNVWGTNYSMWFEGSLTYRFKIEFEK